jgi:hypothetical protein
MAFTYSQEDVARTTVVEETNWFYAKITRYEEKASKKADRAGIANHVVTMKVEDPSSKYNGLVLIANFPEDYPGLAFSFLKAMGHDISKSGGSVDFAEFVNDYVQVCVQPSTYNNKPTNNIVDYRPKDWNPEG